MAEKLSPQDLGLLLAHMGRFPQAHNCPICNERDWNIIGTQAALPYDLITKRAMGPGTGGQVMPVVVVVCQTCGFVRQFAWNAVKAASTGAGGV